MHSVQFEGYSHHCARGLRRAFGESVDFMDFGVFKDGNVEVYCFFGLVVEPEEWMDGWHDDFSVSSSRLNRRKCECTN